MAKKVCMYGIFTALCLIFSYIEGLLSLSFIAPGIKLGISNSIALLLILKKDIKGAFLINISRIIISSLLFSTPFSLLFSLSAGICSLIIMSILSKIKLFSTIGFSILGAVTHNLIQLFVSFLLFGSGVLLYSPFLLISALISGTAIGYLSKIFDKKINTNKLF